MVTQFEYYPYGESWLQEGDGKHNPKYNSQELDKETNFYFYNARYYDPEIGRFVTADSVIDGELSTAGWNRYMYTHGNPIRYKDPTGHERFPTTTRSVKELIKGEVSDEQYEHGSSLSGYYKGKVVNKNKGRYGRVRHGKYPFHPGIDISGDKGDPVVAYTEGKVARVVKPKDSKDGAGGFIIMEHTKKVCNRQNNLMSITDHQ